MQRLIYLTTLHQLSEDLNLGGLALEPLLLASTPSCLPPQGVQDLHGVLKYVAHTQILF
jgi:hypothetical protein